MYLEIPEGIHLPLRPASVPVRVLAFIIDLLLRGALLAFTGAVWLYSGRFGLGLASISTFILLWWHMVLFEVFNQGRSPGKQLMGLQVIHTDGTPVSWAGSLTRNLLRVVDLLPFAYCIGLLSMFSNKNFQRLGDLAAGTLVVYQTQPLTRHSLANVPAQQGLLALLCQYYMLACVLLLGLLLFGAWYAAPRFGPLRAPEYKPRRQLTEHLQASALFNLRHKGQRSLLTDLQKDIQQRAQQRHPGFAQLPVAQQWQVLQQLSCQPSATISQCMRPAPIKKLSAQAFTLHVQRLQQLRSAL